MDEMLISDIFRSIEPTPMDGYDGTSSGTTRVFSLGLPSAVRRLRTVDMNTEINSWIDDTIIDGNLDIPIPNAISRPFVDPDEVAGSEDEVETHLYSVILAPCKNIVKRGLCPNFRLRQPAGKSYADYCWRNVRNQQEPLFIEIKTPRSMSADIHIPEILQERSKLDDLSQPNASNILRQVWAYFSQSHCQYGILTNGLLTMFMRRMPTEPEALYISEPFSNSTLTDSLSILARYSYFLWKSRGAQPIPKSNDTRLPPSSRPDDTNEDSSNVGNSRRGQGGSRLDGNRRTSERLRNNTTIISQTSTGRQDSVALPLSPPSSLPSSDQAAKSQQNRVALSLSPPSSASSSDEAALPLSPPSSLFSPDQASHQLMTDRLIHRGNYSSVHHGEFDGHEVVAKMSLSEEVSNRIVQQEGEKYRKLEQLQGKAIPRAIPQFIERFCQYVIVMEPLLPIKTWTQATVEKACASLTALHTLGYVHGDIRKSNFMQNENGDVFLIDLESAQWSAMIDATFTDEHAQVREFLEGE